MALTNTELKQLAEAHAYRIIDNMSASELFSYAIDQLIDTFDVGSPNKLLADILAYEGEDMDSAAEFMIGAGVPESVVDEALETL